MTRIPYALLRIPLLAVTLFGIAVLCVPLSVDAQNREAEVVNVAPAVRVLEIGYPYWYHPSVGGNQNAFKFGDKTTIWIELEDYALISSVTVDGSEVGGDSATPIPYSFSRTNSWHVYQMPYTINSHGNGLAHIRITATNSLGKSVTVSHEVQLDNVPAEMQIDSLSFVHPSSTPAMGDPMLLSGSIGTHESKLFMYDAYYTLYNATRTSFVRGSFKGTPQGISLSPLQPGTFTDFQVLIDNDATGRFRMAEESAAYITITAVLRDGAGNDTYAVSPLVPIPHTGVSVPAEPGPSTDGISNVLFLPGIEGSRLYVPGSGCTPTTSDCVPEQVWNPAGDSDIKDLFLGPNGVSKRNDVYAKQRDTISNVSIFKFYTSFVEQMDSLKASGSMNDWEPVAYDWRLSLLDLVSQGAQHGDHINYAEATSTPYIEQTLRRLAATSKTGKVTIIAHSNGGLVAKTLLQQFGTDQSSTLVDKIIFIGVPQSGAPEAFAGLLHGYGTALPADWCAQWKILGPFCSKNASRAQARTFAENAPMAYHLLPTLTYFADVLDALHPLVKFSSTNAFTAERNRYGTAIQSEQAMEDFARAVEGGRTKPAASDIVTPNILNEILIGYAKRMHARLDAWSVPSSIHLYQLGGWGIDTLSGIEYYDRKKATGGTTTAHRPMFVEDGDGTVPIPSALMLPVADNVTRYWLNLAPIALRSPLTSPGHETLLEIPEVRSFIQSILENASRALPQFISTTSPKTIHPKKKLLFVLHGPATLSVYDHVDRHTGTASDGTYDHEIPASTYGQLGDARYVIADAGEPYHLVMHGFDTDTASLDLQELVDGNVMASTTFADMQVTASTTATLTITDGLDESPVLIVDADGDGSPESVLHTDGSVVPASPGTVPTYPTSHSASHHHTASPDVATQPIIASSTNVIPPSLIPPPLKPIPVPIKQTVSVSYTEAATSTDIEEFVSTSSPESTEMIAPDEYDDSSNAASVVLASHGFFYNLWNEFLTLLQSLFAFIVKLFS